MALTLEIAGVDRTAWLAKGSCRVSRPLGGRASADAILEDRARGFTPALNAAFVVKDGATKHFAGTIRSISEKCHADGAYTKKQFRLRCLDYNHIADRRRTSAITFTSSPAATLRDIVLDIVSTFFDGESVTTANVAVGPTILEPVTLNYNTISEAFNKLSAITANYGDPYLWHIDFNKDLHFSQFVSNPAPFSLTNSSNNFWDLEIETTLDNYRNVQHARTEFQIATTLTESFVGNGVQTSFLTSAIISSAPVVRVNGVQKTVGELGVDHTGKDFYWIRDGYGIFNQDHAVLTGAQTLTVVYAPPATNIVTATNSAGVTAYGKFEAVDEQKNIDDYDTLVAMAEGGLTQFGTVPTKPKFRTRTAGLAPGQRLTINLTRHSINTEFLIEDISFTWIPARTDFLEFDISCTSLERAAPARTAWMEKLVEMARIGRPPQEITAAAAPSGGGGVGGWSEQPSGSMDGANTSFSLASAPSPSGGLILAANGVILRQGTDYSLSGLTITMSSAPLSTDWLRAWYDFNYIYNAEIPSNTSPLGGIYVVSGVPLSASLIFAINGAAALNGTDYTLAASTVDFADAPEATDWAMAWYATFAGAGYSYNETPSGAIDGANLAFNLAVAPSGCMVVVNGVLQAEGLDYTRSGTTITFLAAPTSGDWIRVWSKA